MAAPVNVNDVLDGHVALDLQCLDRIYLNAYVPNLQVGGQVASFLTQHLGNPIPSPAIFEKIGAAFRKAVSRFAEDEHVPVVRFTKDDPRSRRCAPMLPRRRPPGGPGGPRSAWRRSTPACSPERRRRRPTAFRGSPSPRPIGG